VRERLRAVLVGGARAERLRAWGRVPEFIAARPVARRWELILVRHGRLAATGWLLPGTDPAAALADLRRAAEHVPLPDVVGGDTPAEETDLVIGWCQEGGARLVEVSGDARIALPVRGAHRWALPPRG